jgi:hypothetical protein
MAVAVVAVAVAVAVARVAGVAVGVDAAWHGGHFGANFVMCG